MKPGDAEPPGLRRFAEEKIAWTRAVAQFRLKQA